MTSYSGIRNYQSNLLLCHPQGFVRAEIVPPASVKDLVFKVLVLLLLLSPITVTGIPFQIPVV